MRWPDYDVERDSPTLALLHLASQMLGKLRVAHSDWVNHGWHATLRPTASGLATLPTAAGSGRSFTLAIELVRHGIAVDISDGTGDFLPFAGQSVAELHRQLVAMLDRHGLPSSFHGRPNEIEGARRFADDDQPRPYRRDSAERLHGMLQAMLPVFQRFRAGFTGKSSPVHFFWGSFDLAVTRFSGRPAPPHPGGVPGLPDRIAREAYSQEVSSAGFWPGGVTPFEPIFYGYAYPEPPGYRDSAIAPEAAVFDPTLGEFTLAYAAVRAAAQPEAMLTRFLQSAYDHAADLGRWDRQALERDPVRP